MHRSRVVTLVALRAELRRRFPTVVVHLRQQGATVELQLLAVPRHERGRGVGSRVLERLCRWADSSGVLLTLTPDGAFGMDVRRLTNWYQGFGFQSSAGSRKLERQASSWIAAAA
jgi:GNAT superfamily N-acetyltransferase